MFTWQDQIISAIFMAAAAVSWLVTTVLGTVSFVMPFSLCLVVFLFFSLLLIQGFLGVIRTVCRLE